VTLIRLFLNNNLLFSRREEDWLSSLRSHPSSHQTRDRSKIYSWSLEYHETLSPLSAHSKSPDLFCRSLSEDIGPHITPTSSFNTAGSKLCAIREIPWDQISLHQRIQTSIQASGNATLERAASNYKSPSDIRNGSSTRRCAAFTTIWWSSCFLLLSTSQWLCKASQCKE